MGRVLLAEKDWQAGRTKMFIKVKQPLLALLSFLIFDPASYIGKRKRDAGESESTDHRNECHQNSTSRSLLDFSTIFSENPSRRQSRSKSVENGRDET